MANSDTVGDLLRHRTRLLGWVFGGCVIPGALLLAADVTPEMVLGLVFLGAVLTPWAVNSRILVASFGPAKSKAARYSWLWGEITHCVFFLSILLNISGSGGRQALFYLTAVLVALWPPLFGRRRPSGSHRRDARARFRRKAPGIGPDGDPKGGAESEGSPGRS